MVFTIIQYLFLLHLLLQNNIHSKIPMGTLIIFWKSQCMLFNFFIYRCIFVYNNTKWNMDLKYAIMVIDCYRNFTILLHYMMGVSGVVYVTYLRQHKKTIGRIIGCILLYSLLCLVIQWGVHDSARYILNKKIFFCGGALAANMELWRYQKAYIISCVTSICIFLSASYVPMLTGQHIAHQDVMSALIMGTAMFLIFSILHYVVNGIQRKWIRQACHCVLYLSGGIALLIPLLIWGYYIVSHHVLSATIALTLFQTNGSETISYLKDQNLYTWVGTFILLCAVIGLVTKLLWQMNKKTGMMAVSVRALVLTVVFTLGVSGYAVVKASDYLPVRIARETKSVLQEYKKYGEARQQREEKLRQLQNLKISGSGGVFVLVIGESESRDHMQAYGYSRDTTPWLSQQIHEPDTILFTHAYSNHTHTVPVLTYALSEKNQYNTIKLEDAYSIVEVAKAAGYDTYWLSNQRKYSAWDTPIAEMASTANHQVWLNERTGTEDCRSDYYDETLVQALPDLRAIKNALIVIHLMGCHGSYGDRYPGEWNVFHGKEKRVDEYDNAVRYNDYVLKQIYEAVKISSEFKGMIYFSDHGDDADKGYSHEASKFTYPMSHIPFFMIFSPHIRRNKANLWMY